MKKIAIFAILVLLLTAACQQTTEREVSSTSTSESTTVEPANVDTAAANEAAADATAATTDAARDAAHETGTAMETAGQAIQEKTETTNTR
jgi:ABC-type Fe3+-hydroxamate transport system substrate-binding protein